MNTLDSSYTLKNTYWQQLKRHWISDYKFLFNTYSIAHECARTHAHKHRRTHTNTDTHARACTYAHIDIDIHARAPARAHTHTHTHTQTHKHTLPREKARNKGFYAARFPAHLKALHCRPQQHRHITPANATFTAELTIVMVDTSL